MDNLDPHPVIGIDLGTTNSALAYTRGEAVESFAIPQLVQSGEVREQPLLPSYLFLDRDGPIVGTLAQRKGVEVPAWLVSSAKSWLSYSGVDRNAAILPPNAPEGLSKVSPVQASCMYLRHLLEAWNTKNPELPFAAHHLLITVPASFDAVARDLTRKAAAEAGYQDVILLEEPQAVFYAWIERNPNWRELVKVGDLVLVIDIGGGTSDFSLIAVTENDGEMLLERTAVGDHILLGGDNIDIALAHHVAAELPKKLDAIQFQGLLQLCRRAKECLLEEGNTDKEQAFAILGQGTSVVGGSIKTKLRRKDLEAILLDGFFPAASLDDKPQARRATLTELGLPYASDAAITRHLADFLQRSRANPTRVLFNGGVLRAGIVRERILALLNDWFAQSVTELDSSDLLHAVARGAAYYGLARQGRGVRVRGGVPRTYYVGIEAAAPAVPGMQPVLKALTVVPFGMEEGTGHQIQGRQFALSIGETAQFRFFQSSGRKEDAAGMMFDEIPQNVEETAPVEVFLPGNPGETVAVTLESLVTETGVLELWFVGLDGRRWKLDFNVRPKSENRRKGRT